MTEPVPPLADPIQQLVTHAEVIATASVRIEEELREKVTRLRDQQQRLQDSLRTTRRLGIAVSIAFVLLACLLVLLGVIFVNGRSHDRQLAQDQAEAQRQQLRTTMCGGFVPLAQQPINAQTSDLGKSLIFWARSGIAELDCPVPPPARPQPR